MFRCNPLPAQPSEGEVVRQARVDRLRLLFRQSFFATFGSFGSGLALSWLQWDLGNRDLIVPWVMALCVTSLMRIGVFWSYRCFSPNERTAPWWERVYWLTLVITAGTWGLGATLIMSPESLVSQVITLFFAIGMAGSAISAYSAYRSMTLAAIALVLLPTTFWLLLHAGMEQRLLAVSALAFATFVVRTTKELSSAMQSLLQLRHQLEIEHRIATDAARTDELTGLNNRRAFFERAEEIFALARRHQLPLCALLIDIDHFKRVNDTYGHAAGDQVLKAVAETLKSSLRESDLYGRLGGEEFAVLLPGTDSASAHLIAEKLRHAVQSMGVLNDRLVLRVTISIGLTEDDLHCPDLRSLLAIADAAMYQAKSKGRNQVHGGMAVADLTLQSP